MTRENPFSTRRQDEFESGIQIFDVFNFPAFARLSQLWMTRKFYFNGLSGARPNEKRIVESQGFKDLKDILNANPNAISPTAKAVEQYADSPDFFKQFMGVNGTSVLSIFKTKLYKSGEMIELIRTKKIFFREHLKDEHLNLDNLDYYKQRFCAAFRMKTPRTSVIAKRLIEEDLIDPTIPDNHILIKSGKRSYYVNSDVVSPEQLNANLKKWVNERWKNLNDVRFPAPVGGLANILGLPNKHYPTIAKACVERGFINPVLPEGASFQIHGQNTDYFVDENIVGKEQKRANIRRYLSWTYGSLDDIDMNRILSYAIGIPKLRNKFMLVSELVQQGYMSPIIPDGHPLGRLGMFHSWYINPKIVGEELAMENAKRYVQYTYKTADDIKRKNSVLCSFFAIDPHSPIKGLREKLTQLGWLSGGSYKGFRPYASENLPPTFNIISLKKQPVGISARIGVLSDERPTQRVGYVKGEVFEQLVGFLLSYLHPSELIIPQYCLYTDITRGKASVRVDFKAGNNLYEAKWGNDEESANKSARLHTSHIKKYHDGTFKYHLIRLVHVVPLERLPDLTNLTSFEEMLKNGLIDNSQVSAMYQAIGQAIIREASGPDQVQSSIYLTRMRDGLYNLVNIENQINNPSERKEFIANKLREICSRIDNREECINYMNSLVKQVFSPREAHFTVDDTLYRMFIEIPNQAEEDRKRYQTIYYFGNLRFIGETPMIAKLYRDTAVLIEMADRSFHIRKILRHSRKKVQDDPIFMIPRRGEYNSFYLKPSVSIGDPAVFDLEKEKEALDSIRKLLGISDGDYEFAIKYIEYEDKI